MKTKFDSLLKLKKQALDKIEREIIKNNYLITAKYQELNTLMVELSEVCIPQVGNYWDFKRTGEIKKILIYQMDFIKEEISGLRNIAKKLQGFYRAASVEYEKIKYLQENEIKKILGHLKKSEIKNLDEVALMLFTSNKENI
ncbi:hypothetical protein BKH41_03220 [Helicobacter sp. 12S02232-10]|uniref:flagellar export protein FliJ n=1 Tax=Helicobacter sp. 12S02232-10 TaxID=1476197 RepID=UPI000BA76A66|nr:flagellar export protein FliJ [Helicobacter sp. 12S02232-10]PAF49113.1 hypothetical protein BKH41_03220 [Helicobacter sp. 12S02232-10]